jgi:hypothetical protein
MSKASRALGWKRAAGWQEVGGAHAAQRVSLREQGKLPRARAGRWW